MDVNAVISYKSPQVVGGHCFLDREISIISKCGCFSRLQYQGFIFATEMISVCNQSYLKNDEINIKVAPCSTIHHLQAYPKCPLMLFIYPLRQLLIRIDVFLMHHRPWMRPHCARSVGIPFVSFFCREMHSLFAGGKHIPVEASPFPSLFSLPLWT